MTVVISGTNRPESNTLLVSKYIFNNLITSQKHLIDIGDYLPLLNAENLYDGDKLPSEFKDFQDEILIPADKIIVVSPEYNGSFPGVLKTFFDAISLRKSKDCLSHKKGLLIGIASGRAGNLRGMEHISGFLNYLGVIIYPNKLPISKVGDFISDKKFNGKELNALNNLLEEFAAF